MMDTSGSDSDSRIVTNKPSGDNDTLKMVPVDKSGAPVSGVDTAMVAGASLLPTAQSILAQKARRGVRIELPAYLGVQIAWFSVFGLQMVLFPYLITNRLMLGGTELGLANLALSAPVIIFLLIGGVVAERAVGRTLLILLHVCAAIPAFALAAALSRDWLSYPLMLAYALTMGVIGAFMMPARDSALNEIVERRGRIGSGITLQQGIAFSTLAQFIAQIAGLIVGGYADKMTQMPIWLGGFGVGPIKSADLIAIQGIVAIVGALCAVFIARGRRIKTRQRYDTRAAFGDIMESIKVVTGDVRLWAMTILMFGVGIFIIGAFLVVLPIVNRDVYGLSSDGIRDMFVTFWLGAFVSSTILSVFSRIRRPGRLLIIAQFCGVLAIFPMTMHVPHPAFLCIVFVWGLSGGVSIAMSRSIVQTAAPRKQLARVLSIYQLGFMGGAPFGAVFMGGLTDMVGPHMVAFIPILGMMSLIVWLIVFTPVWNLTPPAAAAKS